VPLKSGDQLASVWQHPDSWGTGAGSPDLKFWNEPGWHTSVLHAGHLAFPHISIVSPDTRNPANTLKPYFCRSFETAHIIRFLARFPTYRARSPLVFTAGDSRISTRRRPEFPRRQIPRMMAHHNSEGLASRSASKAPNLKLFGQLRFFLWSTLFRRITEGGEIERHLAGGPRGT
jgi:hypothetical protein